MMNTLKLIIVFLLLAGTSGCASYLYSAYIPATAYSVARAIEGDNPEAGTANTDFMVASADNNAGAAGDSTPVTDASSAGDETGRIFDNMRTATARFQDLLNKNRIENASNYVLTRLENPGDKEFVMVAAVYRPDQMIEVRDTRFPGTTNIITDKSPAYYEPYRMDTGGQPLDRVVAWSLVPKECFLGAHQQEVVLKDTAEAVSSKAMKTDFWAARYQWEKGDVGQVLLAGHLQACPARFSG